MLYMGAVITTDNEVFFDELQVYEKTGLENRDPTHELYPQFKGPLSLKDPPILSLIAPFH